MKRPTLLSASFAIAVIGVVTAATAGRPPAPAPLPALPGGEGPGSDADFPGGPAKNDAPQVAAPARSPQELYERVRRGVVALERNGAPVAIGTVLDGDGRVLTSLSGLGGADAADIRYADGTTVHAKVGHGDKNFDLALLIPQAGKWTEGLAASESDPLGAPLRAMIPARGARLGPAEAGIKGRVDAHARDGEPMPSMLDLDVKGPLVAGAPLLDATGGVVGVLVRACKGAAVAPDPMPWAAWAAAQNGTAKAPVSCTPVVLGAPVSAIRSFLSHAPAAPIPPAPWLGVRVEPVEEGTVRGVRVVGVAPSSPAQKAGLRPATDVIVAADGAPIDTPDKLASAIGKHAPGDAIKLLVFGEERFREVAVSLRSAP